MIPTRLFTGPANPAIRSDIQRSWGSGVNCAPHNDRCHRRNVDIQVIGGQIRSRNSWGRYMPVRGVTARSILAPRSWEGWLRSALRSKHQSPNERRVISAPFVRVRLAGPMKRGQSYSGNRTIVRVVNRRRLINSAGRPLG